MPLPFWWLLLDFFNFYFLMRCLELDSLLFHAEVLGRNFIVSFRADYLVVLGWSAG